MPGSVTDRSTHPVAAESPEDLVQGHMGLARALAARYRGRGESTEDLTQVAYLGLVAAAQHYRPEAGQSFPAYAVPTITGELRRHFRDKGWQVRPPRRLQEVRAAAQKAEETLVQRLARRPSPEEVGDYVGVPAADVEEARVAAGGYFAVSLDAPGPGGGDTLGWGDVVPADNRGEESLDFVVDSLTVRPLLGRLAPREQRILALRFYCGCTQQQIAEQVGVTQMQVSRLISQSLATLRAALSDGEPLGA